MNARPGFFDLNSFLVRLAGIVALLSIPLQDLPRRINTILPFDPDVATHYVSLFVGIALIYLASQLRRRKRSAYILAVVGLGIAVSAVTMATLLRLSK